MGKRGPKPFEACDYDDQRPAYASREAKSQAVSQAAAALGVSEDTIRRSNLCAKPLVSVQKRLENAENAEKTRKRRKLYAQMVKNHEISKEMACAQCPMSERTLRRYLKELG